MQNAPFRGDPVELGRERPVAAADELDVLEEGAGLDPLDELLLGEEPVLAAVASPGRCGRVVAETATSSSGWRSSSRLISVPLPAPLGPVMTKTGSGLAVEEANQFGALALGEAAHRLRLADPALVQEPGALTRPNLGTAMSMSKTFAVETYSGGSSRIPSIGPVRP